MHQGIFSLFWFHLNIRLRFWHTFTANWIKANLIMFSYLIIKIWIYINLWGTRLEKTDSEKLNISFREVITNTFNLHDGQTGNANVIEVRQNFIKECIPVTCKTDLVLFLAKVKVWEQEKNSYKNTNQYFNKFYERSTSSRPMCSVWSVKGWEINTMVLKLVLIREAKNLCRCGIFHAYRQKEMKTQG